MSKKRKPADTEEKSLDELLADAKTVPDEEKALDKPEHCKVHDLPEKPIEEIILEVAAQLHSFIKVHNARLVQLSGDNIACGRTVRYFDALDCAWDRLSPGLQQQFKEHAHSVFGTLLYSEKEEQGD